MSLMPNTFRWLFAIRRDERRMALCALLVLIALHGLLISRYNAIFMDPGPGSWARFLHYFRLSGYDPITYSIVTSWTALYNVFRHPLLAFFVAPLCWLNNGLTALTGINCVLYVVAAVWIVFGLYAFIFSYRIQRELVGVSRSVAIMLSALLFGLAHVMVATIAPDHFLLSLMMLLLVIYLCGTLMRQHRQLTIWQTVVIFVVTGGISLSNGVKVFLCGLFTNGRRFFRLRYLLLAVLLPSALLWTTARIEYKQLVLPMEKAKHAQIAADRKRKQEAAARKKAEAERTLTLQLENAAKAGDTTQLAQLSSRLDSVRRARPAARRNPYGKPIAKNGFMRWTDITTSRTDALVENLFGEGVQLHEDHLLGDVLRHRPIIVGYRHAFNYVVEAFLVLLLLFGIVAGLRRQPRFMLMILSCVAFDMLLHLGLGFGLNEVYIMSAHWMFIIPIALGFLLQAAARRTRLQNTLLITTALLTLWLWGWNLTLLARFLLSPLS